MRRLIVLSVSLFLTVVVAANTAMPGMWQTGHGGRFIPLFRHDSIHFGKIQMQRELVMINLYPGFAAVKGEYWMYNTTDETVTMRAGYPVNGTYDAAVVQNVMFNDLHHLKVMLNGQPVNVEKADGYDSAFNNIEGMRAENWYYFTCTFAPKTLTRITVYFLTNNSDAQLLKGYAKQKGSAFAYILESGRAWAGKIEQGQILIKLNEGLELGDFHGILPKNTLTGDDTHLAYMFRQLEPDSSNNILLWYAGAGKQFRFDSVAVLYNTYFTALDQFPVQEFSNVKFKKTYKTDFIPKDDSLTWIVWVLVAILVVALSILGFLIWMIVKLYKKYKEGVRRLREI